jgi:hypothetical protein
MAAVLAAEPHRTDEVVWPAVASHLTAAYLWGLLRYRPDAMHVTAPTRRRAEREFEVHFSSVLAEEDRAVREEIPLTALPRTLLDLAATAGPGRLEGCLDRAEAQGLLDLRAGEALLARAGGHRGRGRLARALRIYRPDPAFERSKLERRFRMLAGRAGLPPPSMNFNVAGYELDAYWETERFGVELDVFETHGSRAAFERDRRREDDLMLIGVETIRVTGPRLRSEPGATIERVRAHLERRRRERAPAAAPGHSGFLN